LHTNQVAAQRPDNADMVFGYLASLYTKQTRVFELEEAFMPAKDLGVRFDLVMSANHVGYVCKLVVVWVAEVGRQYHGT
jgi:hypothetical protein